MGIKIFNHLPDYIKGLINEKQAFKNALERFLLDNIFYSVNDYLNYSTSYIIPFTVWKNILIHN